MGDHFWTEGPGAPPSRKDQPVPKKIQAWDSEDQHAIPSPHEVLRYLNEDERIQGIVHKDQQAYDLAWYLYQHEGDAFTLSHLTRAVYEPNPNFPDTQGYTSKSDKAKREAVRNMLKRSMKDGCEPYAPIRVERVGSGKKGDPYMWKGVLLH